MSIVNETSALAIGILFIVLGILAVSARFGIRWSREQNIGIDDWLCLPALVSVIGCCAVMIIGAATHTIRGPSLQDPGPAFITNESPDQSRLEKLEISLFLIQVLGLACIKLSILFLYRRLFVGQAFNIVSWVLIGVVVAWGFAFIVAQLAACGTDFNAYFGSLADLKENCSHTFPFYIALTVTDVMVDLMILIMPIPHIWALQMSLQRKFAVLAVLLVGSLAIACGITRMVYYILSLAPGLTTSGKIAEYYSTDTMGVVSCLMFWTVLEVGVAMVAACLPLMRPLFRGWSLRSIFHRIHPVIGLRSMCSSTRFTYNDRKMPDDSESQTAITGIPADTTNGGWNSPQHGVSFQAYVMGKVSGRQGASSVEKADGKIRREIEIKQTLEDVSGTPRNDRIGGA